MQTTGKTISFYFFLILLLIFEACIHPPTPPTIHYIPTSSWEIIRETILAPNCEACHSPGTSFAKQSNLILTRETAYNQLVNRKPHNSAALADSLILIGTKGLESLYNSFLWEKINSPNQAHFYDDHPEYGELMPWGGIPLTNGELAYIRKWILEGAPKEGFVVDEALLEDESRFEWEAKEFQHLAVPENGFQLHVGPFEVQPNIEREFFYYHPLNNPEPIYVNQITYSMRTGSHHFLLYDYLKGKEPNRKEEIRDLRGPNGNYWIPTIRSIRDQIFIHGTQWRYLEYQYPPGIALKILPSEGIDMNIHYVNRSNEIMTGEVYANLHTIEPSEVEHIAYKLFLNNEDIKLLPNQITTLQKTFIFDELRHIFTLYSHAHEHLQFFKVFISGGERDGELVYFSRDFEHPPILEYDPPIRLEAGTGLTLEVTYNNWTDRVIKFGLLSEDEMMMLFGGYYLE